MVKNLDKKSGKVDKELVVTLLKKFNKIKGDYRELLNIAITYLEETMSPIPNSQYKSSKDIAEATNQRKAKYKNFIENIKKFIAKEAREENQNNL